MTANVKHGLFGFVAVGLLLAGCSAGGVPSTAPDSAGGGASSAPTQPCIVGVWSLDVGDYENQSIRYVNSLAVPMDDYYLNGSQTLSVTADGLFRLDTNISTGGTLVLDGYSKMLSTTTTGISTADWSPGEEGTIDLENWVDDLVTTGDAPEETGLGGGVGFGSVPNVLVTCDGDGLKLGGLELPVYSRWTRQ
jgi:hypothetical protein